MNLPIQILEWKESGHKLMALKLAKALLYKAMRIQYLEVAGVTTLSSSR